ncbi:quinone-dependent dihydroorotate dehydrogenase [Kordiimonas sp. SCSIO 12610]|uniref:quinone-dependent dihydroorotate dehydrogenase n=1 Tax=Kordiimonas sp. SCSIO 12610 TaxID=2829597 RepID=UPI00210E165C|nr:quinone-dependent dihydroorotate dehydrogenase [Kordiimonas sp. SCSIO 12610]UTW55507.1 quinone-dependent dihydroorotate dehydrogenase [Kordiimonas sp. SCSIO 12610]
MSIIFNSVKPFIHSLDPEKAHNLTIRSLKAGLGGLFAGHSVKDTILNTNVFGLSFDNPIGLAAGFDKNAEVMRAMLAMGFGFVEAGTVTPKAQDGNEKPRLFRLSEDKAVINRFGFNNEGLDPFKKRLKSAQNIGIIGANVGANKEATDRTEDYVNGVESLYGLCSYFTINISSPNTSGLRALQSKASLVDLVERVLTVRSEKINNGAAYTPILVKIAPDLTTDDIDDISDVARSYEIDGLIVSNTTITRPNSLRSQHKHETGGLSGKPLMEPSTETLRTIYSATEGKVPLVGVGGVSSGKDAFEKICAGASLVQLYSALVYSGPGLVNQINKELAVLLRENGFNSVKEAVGSGV